LLESRRLPAGPPYAAAGCSATTQRLHQRNPATFTRSLPSARRLRAPAESTARNSGGATRARRRQTICLSLHSLRLQLVATSTRGAPAAARRGNAKTGAAGGSHGRAHYAGAAAFGSGRSRRCRAARHTASAARNRHTFVQAGTRYASARTPAAASGIARSELLFTDSAIDGKNW